MPKIINFNKQLSETDRTFQDIEKSLTKVVQTYRQLVDASISLDKTLKENKTSHENNTKAVKKTNDNLDILAQSIKEEEKLQKKTVEILAKARAERSETGKEMAKAAILRSEQNKKIKEEIKLRKAESGSINQLRSENRKLREEMNNLNPTLDNNIVRYAELKRKIKENDEIIKNNADSYVQQKINIGNYQSALDALLGPLGNVASGIQGVGQQMMALLANPIVATFAAIALVVGALGKSFASTRDGALKFGKATSLVSADIDIMKKKFREFSVDLAGVFEKGGLESSLKNMSKWYSTLFEKMNDKGAIQGIKDTLSELVNTQKENAKGFYDEVGALAAVRQQLLQLRDAYNDIDNESRTRIANLQSEADLLAITADDDTVSMAQMIEARIKLGEVEMKRTKEEAFLANERLKIADMEIEEAIKAGHIRREASGELVSITKEGIEIEKAYTDTKIEAIQASNEILRVEAENNQKRRMTELDVFEQRLDLILDVADAQKTVNEQIIADTDKSLTFRQEKLVETQGIMKESFNDQIKLFEDFNEIELDTNKLLKLNNTEIVMYAEGLQISERGTNRLREVIVERRKAEQDLAAAQAALNKEQNDRLKAAEETVKGIEQERIRRNLKTIEEIKKQEIAWENEKYQRLINEGKVFQEVETENGKKMIEVQTLLNEELEALKYEHEERMFDIEEEFRKKKEEKDKEDNEKFITKNQEEITATQNLINEGFNYYKTSKSNELAILENQYQREIELAGDNTKLKEKIDENYQKQKNKLERQAAINEKIQAVFNAGINTAVAVTKSLPNYILAALVAATGAAQIASIIAQPIPQYWKGTGPDGVLKDTWAEVGEKGRELIISDSGPWLAENRMYTHLKKGDRVIPNRETEKILSEYGGITNHKLDQIIALEKQRQSKQTTSNTIINGDKFHKTVEYGNSRIKFENEYFGH